MSASYFKVVRLNSIDASEIWLATFADCRDADNFCKLYMETAKYDDGPAGYPIVKLLHAVIDDRNKRKYGLVKSFYPNAHDCAFVECLEGGYYARD